MRFRRLVMLVAAVAVMASACSSAASQASLRDPAVAGTAQGRSTTTSTPSAVDQTQRLTVSRVDAEAGGVVELAGRARLTVPPGALTNNAEVRITAIGAVPSAIAFPLEQPVAPAVNVEVRGAELTEPTTLELLFDPAAIDLPDDPIATSAQWVDIEWQLQDSSIDPDGGVVSTTSTSPNGWWRPSVWDWSRLPDVIDRTVAGLDTTPVAEPDCTTPVPAWVQRIELGQAATAPAHVCAGGFGEQLAVRVANHRPFSLAIDSSQPPAWGWTNTTDQRHLQLTEIIRAAQPDFDAPMILPRLTEGAIGIAPGDFAGGRIVGQASATTMALDIALLVADLAGAVDLDGWEPLLACAVPSEDGPVRPDQATQVVRRLADCANQLSDEDLPSGYGEGVLAALDQLAASTGFAAAVESMMEPAEHMSGALYWIDPDRVADEPATPPRSAAAEREPLPLPPASFAPSSPTPPVTAAKPADPTPPAAGPTPTTPRPTEPPATQPPATNPPATEPPATEPPATEPPATQPPATEPRVTLPPVTATVPPTVPPTVAPTTAPPTTEQKRRGNCQRRWRPWCGDDDDGDDDD